MFQTHDEVNHLSKRTDDMVNALHAAVLALSNPNNRPGNTWVFSSQTADGAWQFTYASQDAAPGAGWRLVSSNRIESVTGGEGFVRVNL